MRIHSIIFLTLILLAAGVLTGSAQVQEGLSEVNLSGAYNVVSSNGESVYSIMLSTSYGYFLFSQLEAGADFSLNKVKEEDTIGSVGPFVSFHYPFSPDAKVVPFIGVQGGTTFGFEENLAYYGGFLGVKAFIGNGGGGAVSLQAFYLRQDPSKKTKPFDQYGLMTGISIFLD